MKLYHLILTVAISNVAVLGMMTAAHAGTTDGSESTQHDQQAAIYDTPKKGGPRRLQVVANDVSDVHLYATPSSESARLDVLADSAVFSSLGCFSEEKRVWCHLKPLQRNAIAGYVLSEFLVPARGPDGTIPMGPDQSRKRARTQDFDARAQVACAQEVGQTLGSCSAQVARGGGGDAAVVVRFNNGFARTLYFVHGMFTSANATMSGVGTDTDWKAVDGIHFIRVDDQRYEIAETFILGELSEGG